VRTAEAHLYWLKKPIVEMLSHVVTDLPGTHPVRTELVEALARGGLYVANTGEKPKPQT